MHLSIDGNYHSLYESPRLWLLDLKTYDYDFKYDARIDRMLSIVGVKGLHFVPYYKSAPNARKIYSAYRYLPLRLANILIAHI